MHKGAIFCVFGPDGSGKSSLKRAFAERLLKHRRLVEYHWRPGFLPYSQNRRNSGPNIGNEFNPSDVQTRSKFLSVFLLVYYYLDFLLHLSLRQKKHFRTGDIIYHERYFYDLLVDQKRYGLNVSFLFRLFLARTFKKPHFVILLKAEPKIIFSRKKELSISEIEVQNKEYMKIFKLLNIVPIVLDVGVLSVDECAEELMSLLKKYNFER